MRIAIHDYAGFGFPLSLSKELADRGHYVLHLYTQASGGPKTSFEEYHSKYLHIVNIDEYYVDKDSFLHRWLQERRYGNLAIGYLKSWVPDVVISGNTPLEAQKQILMWAKEQSIPTIFWLQDLLSVAAKSIISKVNRVAGFLIYKYLNGIEKKALSQANHVITITQDFLPILKRWQIDPIKTSVIPNWGPIEQISPLPRKNEFSEVHRLNDNFILLYSGTLGKKQDICLIADIASNLCDDIKFVVATDNRGHRLLKRHLPLRIPTNLILLPLQSSKKYPYLLASADAILVTLEASAGTYCVPSKLWSAFCAQRPSIVAVDRFNLTARITKKYKAGIIVPPGSTNKCIESIQKLKRNPLLCSEMGKNARRYAEKHFHIANITDAFEAICCHLVCQTSISR